MTETLTVYSPSGNNGNETEVMIINFIPTPTNGNQAFRCVDGRPDPSSELGPQMLGGVLHPLALKAIYDNLDFNHELVNKGLNTIEGAGSKTGVHRGAHKSELTSDCGFADRIKEIIETAINQRSLITTRLLQIYEANQEKFPNINQDQFSQLVDAAYERISAYDTKRITINGEPLIRHVEGRGSPTELVEGDHKEIIAFVNLRKDTTLDTLELNKRGQQAFNLDLFAATDCAEVLAVPTEFSIPASLIFYMATEMVLVENKGKPALPVEIHT